MVWRKWVGIDVEVCGRKGFVGRIKINFSFQKR